MDDEEIERLLRGLELPDVEADGEDDPLGDGWDGWGAYRPARSDDEEGNGEW